MQWYQRFVILCLLYEVQDFDNTNILWKQFMNMLVYVNLVIYQCYDTAMSASVENTELLLKSVMIFGKVAPLSADVLYKTPSC
jgi:hypothetical protein